MIDSLTSAQAVLIDQMNRGFDTVYTGGLSQLFNDILSTIASGDIGIQSAATDVDAICLGGGEFTYNPDTTTGLTLGYNAGRYHNGYQLVNVSAGTVGLAASSTNYIELDRSLGIQTNTTGFTAGRMPLMVVTTSTSAVLTVANNRCIICLIGPNGVSGQMLSTPASTKSVEKNIASVSATTAFTMIAPVTGVVRAVTIASATAVATNNTNYWSYTLVDKASSNNIVDTGAENGTTASAGSAQTAYVARTLTLNASTGATNVTAGDVLEFTATATGSPTAMNEFVMRIDYGFSS